MRQKFIAGDIKWQRKYLGKLKLILGRITNGVIRKTWTNLLYLVQKGHLRKNRKFTRKYNTNKWQVNWKNI